MTIALLNCYNSSQAVIEGLSYINNEPWVLILNEHNINWNITLNPELSTFSDTFNQKVVIFTNTKSWNITWADPRINVIALRNNDIFDTLRIYGIYLSPNLKSNIPEYRRVINLIHEKIRGHGNQRCVIGGDVNTDSPICSNHFERRFDGIIENTFTHLKLISAVNRTTEIGKSTRLMVNHIG